MILRIRKRDLFSLSGEILLSPDSKKDLKDSDAVLQELIAIKKNYSEIDSKVDDKDIFCTIAKLGYGAGGKDPVKEKYFTDYSAKRRGAKHPDQMKTFENSKIKVDFGKK
jgi:hypothetical protein